jgi:hypothetical protein
VPTPVIPAAPEVPEWDAIGRSLGQITTPPPTPPTSELMALYQASRPVTTNTDQSYMANLGQIAATGRLDPTAVRHVVNVSLAVFGVTVALFGSLGATAWFMSNADTARARNERQAEEKAKEDAKEDKESRQFAALKPGRCEPLEFGQIQYRREVVAHRREASSAGGTIQPINSGCHDRT